MSYAAIPTLYNGVQFRSRLEARWAAFFDLCHWKWEYEPIDLNGWIPDFRVIDSGRTAHLCEVKQVTFGDAPNLLNETLREMTVALKGIKPVPYRIYHDIMIAGTNLDSLWMGYTDGDYCSPLTRQLDEEHTRNDLRAELERLWKQAGNTVQWKRPS